MARFQESMTTGGLLGYVDALSGGSISRVGVFSLGEPLSIHASILSAIFMQSFPRSACKAAALLSGQAMWLCGCPVGRLHLPCVFSLGKLLGMHSSTGMLLFCFRRKPGSGQPGARWSLRGCAHDTLASCIFLVRGKLVSGYISIICAPVQVVQFKRGAPLGQCLALGVKSASSPFCLPRAG